MEMAGKEHFLFMIAKEKKKGGERASPCPTLALHHDSLFLPSLDLSISTGWGEKTPLPATHHTNISQFVTKECRLPLYLINLCVRTTTNTIEQFGYIVYRLASLLTRVLTVSL